MKKLFKSFLVGGLSIAAASALFVGVGSAKEAVEVDAAYSIEKVVLMGSFDSWGAGVNFTVDGSGDYVLTRNLSKDTQFKVYVYGKDGDSSKTEYVGTDWGISSSNIDPNYVTWAEGNSNFKAVSSQILDFKVKSNFFSDGGYGNCVYIQKSSISTFDVTQYAVINGTKQQEPLNVDPGTANATYNPDPATYTGYHFVGWYKHEACADNDEYEPIELVEPITIYAKFVSFSKDSYLYYATLGNGGDMIHTYGGEKEYPSTNVIINQIPGVEEVHGVTRFINKAYNIFKIPYSSESGDTKFKFHDNNAWSNESSEKTLVNKAAYVWEGDDNPDIEAVPAGQAIEFILTLEGKRNAATADVERGGEIVEKQHSICGISQPDALKLCQTYNGLSEKAREYIDKSMTYTWKPNDISQSDNVFFSAIMDELAGIAGGVTIVGHESKIASIIGGTEVATNASILIIAFSVVAVLTLGGVFILRRKEN